MQTTEEQTEHVGDDVRSRVVLPVAMPLAVLGAMVLYIGAIGFVLLHSTKGQAVVYAGIVATGLMVAMTLASSTDEEDMTTAKRLVIAATAVVPLLAVLGIAVGVNAGAVDPGGIIGIDRTPPERAPEGAITGASNAENFCAMDVETESCIEDTKEYTLPAQPDSETFRFLFVNEQSGVAHNLQIFELADDGGAGEEIFGVDEGSVTISGVADVLYEVDQSERVFQPDEQYYFNCIVHPNMNGVLTIGPPVEGAAEGA